MRVRYAIIQDNKVTNITEAEEGFTFPGLTLVQIPNDTLVNPGYGYENGEFIAPPPPSPPNYGFRVTRYAFRKRFTNPEKVAIEIASVDNPSADQATRAQQAALRVYLKDLDNAEYVDLMNQDLRDGVNLLESLGLLATGRATEILDAPVDVTEMFSNKLML